uniref:PUM-HD domain-containing protein n=1 Tax=Poecilia mexicana TaxID=48701 RepID=A0A3B3XJ27_9TELE
MEAKPQKPFSSQPGRKPSFKGKGKDSVGTKFGGKPGAKKPFKPYKNTEKKSKPGKPNDGRKPSFSKTEKRKQPAGGGGPPAKRQKSGKKPPPTEEELKKKRLEKKRELKNNRQQAERKEMFDIISRCKAVWGNLRRKKCDTEQKTKLMKELHGLIRGKMKQMAFAHDSVRVLQCFIQFGNEKQQFEVFEELKDSILEMSKSPYGKHIVKKLLMYGNKEMVAAIIQLFSGHIRKMLRHVSASSIVEYAYNDKAILAQRLMITSELYGNTYTICKSLERNTLETVLAANPEKLENILEETKQVIVPLAQKEQVIRHSVVHKVFLDFFQFAPEKQRSDRKVIIKTMKTYMVKFATGEFGHLVLLAIFDCVDDTKLVKQAVLSELLSVLPEVLGNKHGKKVLLYLLSPRNPNHMLPDIVKQLEQGDGNAHSKKDMAIRRRELLEAASPPLLDHLRLNAAAMVTDKAASVTVRDILASACGDLRPAMTAVAQLANQELVPGGIKGQLHMAEHPAGHLVLKWLIEQDAMLAEDGREERFSRILVDTVGTETMKSWVKVNRGAMVLCSLLNSCDSSVAAEVKAALTAIIPELQRINDHKGAEILLQNLNK